MNLREAMLKEFDREMAGVRTVLERVPHGKVDWKPHAKSRSLGELAVHVAGLAGRAADVLTQDSRTIDPRTMPPPRSFSTAAENLKVFDDNTAKSRAALTAATDADLGKPWTFTVAGKVLFQGPRADAYRTVFMNHLIHHRAQLGVYLRLLDVPVPGLYGPTADEPLR